MSAEENQHTAKEVETETSTSNDVKPSTEPEAASTKDDEEPSKAEPETKLDDNAETKDESEEAATNSDEKPENNGQENDEDTQMNDAEPSPPTEKPSKDSEPLPSTVLTDVPAPSISAKQVIKAEDTKNEIEEKASQFLAKQTYRVIIPSFAAWFDRSKCNDIEKKSLPEFFNNKHRTKTPSIYMEYRNFMIDTFRLNPSEYLTFTACRRNLAGDVAAIMRVFNFLETWGLINYQVDPQTRPSMIGPQFTGHFQVLLDTAKGLVPFIPAKNSKYIPGKRHEVEDVAHEDPTKSEQDTDKLPSKSNGSSAHNGIDPALESVTIKTEPKESKPITTNLNLRRNIYDSTADAIALQDESQRQLNAMNTRTYNCYTCGDDTTKVRYHNLRTKQSLSPLCFQNGFFPSNFSSADFVKIVKAESSATEWTDQEVLLLMEGVEMFEDDWNAIAYHVGTRTKEACIIKFIQLPIEDPYLVQSNKDQKIKTGKASSRSTEKGLAASQNAAASALVGTESPSKLYEALKEFLKENKTAEVSDNGAEIKKLISERANKVADGDKSHLEVNLGLLVTSELDKIKAKMAEFERVERVLAQEKQELELAQQQLLYDRMALKRQSELVLGKLQEATAAAAGAAHNAAMVATGAAAPEMAGAAANEFHKASELAKAATAIAAQPLKRLVPSAVSDVSTSNSGSAGNASSSNGAYVPDSVGKDTVPSLKPVSIDSPQVFTLWSA